MIHDFSEGRSTLRPIHKLKVDPTVGLAFVLRLEKLYPPDLVLCSPENIYIYKNLIK